MCDLEKFHRDNFGRITDDDQKCRYVAAMECEIAHNKHEKEHGDMKHIPPGDDYAEKFIDQLMGLRDLYAAICIRSKTSKTKREERYNSALYELAHTRMVAYEKSIMDYHNAMELHTNPHTTVFS